jgi:hypothetical protein
MVRKIIILCSIFTFSTPAALHQLPMSKKCISLNSPDKKDLTEFLLCFTSLPSDIRRYIFQIMLFDVFETNDQFISRVSSTKRLPLSTSYYYKDMNKSYNDGRMPGALFNVPTAECPYQEKVAVLISHNSFQYLQVIDTTTQCILSSFDLLPQRYKQIALTSDAQTIATIHETIATNHLGHRIPKNVLTFHDLVENKSYIQDIPSFQLRLSDSHDIVFGFNKQGTFAIIRGWDESKKQECLCAAEKKPCLCPLDYKIIPVPIKRTPAEINTLFLWHIAIETNKVVEP